MSMIDDPNQTILQRMFAPAMMPVEQEVTERISMPKSKKPLNTGYGFFPTGGENMFGVESLDLPDKWVTGLGLVTGSTATLPAAACSTTDGVDA